MKKEEIIAKYGEAEYARRLAQKRAYYKAHKEEAKAYNKEYREEHKEEDNAYSKKYREEHPEQVIANSQEQCRKGGKRYAKHLKDNQTGLRGERNRIRDKHRMRYRPYKAIIAPDSQLHHEWIPKTAKYRGVALVEKDAHIHGIIDVIQVLDGEIKVFTEKELREKEKSPDGK